jgi:integrase/recombinase XerD
VANKHAKVLDDTQFAALLYKIGKESDHPERDQVMVLLSYKAGLRAVEIAGLEWKDVTDAEGKVRADTMFVPGNIAKNGKERHVPMNPHLYTALLQLRAVRPADEVVVYGIGRGFGRGHVGPRAGTRMTSSAVRLWFTKLYASIGFEGCSSHSGRRTFITRAARRAGQHDCSIKDVQMLAGHASLSTTERYIEPSPNIGRLVGSL